MQETTRRNLLKAGAAGLTGLAALAGRATAQEGAMETVSAQTFDPRLPGKTYDTGMRSDLHTTDLPARPLPTDEADLAFASVAQQAAWIKAGKLTPTNFTGHPCLVMRAGFQQTKPRTIHGEPKDEAAAEARTPVAVSLWAPLFGEDTLLNFGAAL